jgi:hypothetical protein
MIQINVKITNAIGIWDGSLQIETNTTKDEADNIVDQLIQNANNIKHLAIKHTDGSQSVFTESILSSSVISYLVLSDDDI